MRNLFESFNVKNGIYVTQSGDRKRIAYVDQATSEPTMPHKETFKAHGALWLKNMKTWGWFLDRDPKMVYATKIQPCLEELEGEEAIAAVSELISEFEGGNLSVVNHSSASPDELKNKLKSFKQELVSAVSTQEFKALMEPIIKFRSAQGHRFSLYNSILIWLQDPEATLVKSTTKWKEWNRTVKPGSPSLFMYVPIYRNSTKGEREKTTNEYLKKKGKTSKDELTPAEKEELSILSNGSGEALGFKLVNSFYDYRFTEQMEGKEDLVGNPGDDVEWSEKDESVTEDLKEKIGALFQVINSSNISVKDSENLGSALGVSKSGEIELKANVDDTIAKFNTIAHEFAHELLHQTYLKSNNSELAEFFVGKEQGRRIVEQQAEICAWIVLKNYGYDPKTSINYAGMWGMNADNASDVFDTVARAAQHIINGMDKVMETSISESRRIVSEKRMIDGYTLAKMLGFGDVYIRSKNRKSMKESVSRDFWKSYQRFFG